MIYTKSKSYKQFAFASNLVAIEWHVWKQPEISRIDEKGREWPEITYDRCNSNNKQKAMHGIMDFEPSLKEKPWTWFDADIEWNAMDFHPRNPGKYGWAYIAYTMNMHDGPDGYFGVQMGAREGRLRLI